MFLPLKWENEKLLILDQNKLPEKAEYVQCENEKDVWDAIKSMKVRGAPAIGIAAAFGTLLAVKSMESLSVNEIKRKATEAIDFLSTSRPTAVNLFWALERMKYILADTYEKSNDLIKRINLEAQEIMSEDTQICKKIGEFGSNILEDGDIVLTHCNAGGLATGGYGTALGVFYTAVKQGKKIRVYADETRPRFQGARLTVWELMQAGIDVTLICDNAAGYIMKKNNINVVIVGADRIASNGDTANKIGTYSLANLAKAHNIPFYVAAPISTIDFNIESGEQIPIEERDESEIGEICGIKIAPVGAKIYNPAFDVTPAELITGIITEVGIIKPPYTENIQKLKK